MLFFVAVDFLLALFLGRLDFDLELGLDLDLVEPLAAFDGLFFAPDFGVEDLEELLLLDAAFFDAAFLGAALRTPPVSGLAATLVLDVLTFFFELATFFVVATLLFAWAFFNMITSK